VTDLSKIDRQIENAESELQDLEARRARILAEISSLKARRRQLLELNSAPTAVHQ
jgi:cell division protein FtsB